MFSKVKRKICRGRHLSAGRIVGPCAACNCHLFDDRKREELNAIVHPAVREYVLQQKEAEERAGKLFLLVLEAALLIEEHYDEICDELWYIYTTEENRRARLKASRGYSDAHVDRIFASQLSEEEYRRHCRVVIDNNGTLEETLTQTEEALRREAYE